jgi:hypothetical protein
MSACCDIAVIGDDVLALAGSVDALDVDVFELGDNVAEEFNPCCCVGSLGVIGTL